MARGRKTLLTAAAVGMMIAATVRGAVAAQPEAAGPFHVRVVDAQDKAVPRIAVEVRAPDRPMKSFNADEYGRAIIPADAVAEGALLSAARGKEAVAWMVVADAARGRARGTPTRPALLKLVPLSHRVEGSVIDRQGKPIAGARVGVRRLVHATNGNLSQDVESPDPALGLVVADEAGKFSMTLPEQATAYLFAFHPRHLGATFLARTDARALDPVALDPAGWVAGRVTEGAAGKPVAGAVVAAQLIERHRRKRTDGWGRAVADDQGRFDIGGLEPGVFNVILLEVPGRKHAAAAAVEGVRVKAGAGATADLAVIEGRPLRGVVIDRKTDRPITGAGVGCRGPAQPRSGESIMATTTDAQGRFTFHVPPGEHFVYLFDDPYSSRMSRRVVTVPEQGEVIPLVLLLPSAQVPAAPAPAPERAAAIIDVMVAEVAAPAPPPPPPPAPVGEVVVAVAPVLAPAPATARAPGGVTVTAKAVAAAPAPAPAPMPAPSPMPAPAPARGRVMVEAMTKVARRTVTGRVLDPNGRPLTGVHVAVTPGPVIPPATEPTASEMAATDREGTFVLGELPRRRLAIALSRPRYRIQPAAIAADDDRLDLTYRLQPDENADHQAGLVADEPVPQDLLGRLTFIDLTPYGTNFLADGPGSPSDGNHLNRVPRGVHRMGEAYFRIGEKMVQVRGQSRRESPESVAGIKVAARGKRIHFLHGNQQQAEAGTELGRYVIRYADGSQEKVPIVYGKNLVDWWHYPSQKNDPSAARLAWTGSNDMIDQRQGENIKIRLWAFTWTNPHPDREIAAMDVVSTVSASDPFLIAVTLERE